MHAIYKIRNISDHKFYVGSSVDFNKRKEIHIYQLRAGTHSNKHLLNAWRKFGESSFVFEILEIVKNPDSLLEREQYYIDTMEACDCKIGYNISKTAGSWLGNRHTEETKNKISKKISGTIHSGESKKLMSKNSPRLSGDKHPMYGIKHSDESVNKMKNSSKRISGYNHPMFGKKLTDDRICVLSEKSSGENNPMYGINVYNTWIEKYGYDIAKEMWNECNKRRSLNCLNKGTKGVIQMTISGKYICEFISLTEASTNTGINVSSISQVCKGNKNTAGGYKWEYKNKIN